MFVLGLLFAAFAATGAHAESYATKVVTDVKAKIAFSIVSTIGWIVDGPDTGRYAYVVISPTCQYSQKLFEETRTDKRGIQWRWVFYDPSGEVNSVYEQPSPKTIQAVYEEGTVPADVDAAKTRRINDANALALFYLAGYIGDDPADFGFPIIMYGDKTKFSTIMGLPPNLPAALADIGKSAPLGGTPAILAMADRTASFTTIPKTPYENANSSPVRVRVMPFTDAPTIGAVMPGKIPGMNYFATGVDANGLVRVVADENPTVIYVEDKAFAEKALKGK
jgi:hypothetical protein